MARVGSRDQKVAALARRLLDATIDAAVIEYTQMLGDPDAVNIEHLERKLAAMSRKAVWPRLAGKRTVEQVSSARGNFTW